MTNGVAKLYGRLDAKERAAAWLAAFVRGDDLEQQRLNATAPRRTERRLHHLDRVKAVWTVTALFRLKQLQLTAEMWHAEARLARAELDGEAAEAAAGNATLWQATLNASLFRLSLNVKAWDIVCERLDVPAEFVELFGNCIAADVTESNLAANVPTLETVCESLSALGQSVTADKLETAESIAKQWLRLFDDLGGDR